MSLNQLTDRDLVDQKVILPNQTLLLLKSKQYILQILPNDATPLLKSCLQMLNPLMSFEQMCTQDTLTFEEVVKVVKHFVFWGFGRVIYPIKTTSVYRITDRIAVVDDTVV